MTEVICDAPSLRESPRICGTCRYWDIHSIGSNKGDCRAPDGGGGAHRFWKVPIGKDVFAMMDSFGVETTLHRESCGAWDDGEPKPPGNRKDGSSQQTSAGPSE